MVKTLVTESKIYLEFMFTHVKHMYNELKRLQCGKWKSDLVDWINWLIFGRQMFNNIPLRNHEYYLGGTWPLMSRTTSQSGFQQGCWQRS